MNLSLDIFIFNKKRTINIEKFEFKEKNITFDTTSIIKSKIEAINIKENLSDYSVEITFFLSSVCFEFYGKASSENDKKILKKFVDNIKEEFVNDSFF